MTFGVCVRASVNPGNSFIAGAAKSARQTKKERLQTHRETLEGRRAGMRKGIRQDMEKIAKDDFNFAIDVITAVDDIARGFVNDMCPENNEKERSD